MSLKKEIITFTDSREYFSVAALNRELKRKRMRYSRLSINQYLSDMKKAGTLQDAGRGWYSTIVEPMRLEPSAITHLVTLLEEKFPLLEFSSWSTKQIEGFVQHHLTAFVHFVYADADALSTLCQELQNSGYNAFLNPGKKEAEKYLTPGNKTVVLRPRITEEPSDKHYSGIEKLLVDLFIEREKLGLMDLSEYKKIFFNIVLVRRVNMASMLRYSRRREVRERLVSQVILQDPGRISM